MRGPSVEYFPAGVAAWQARFWGLSALARAENRHALKRIKTWLGEQSPAPLPHFGCFLQKRTAAHFNFRSNHPLNKLFSRARPDT
jgi:hypothetical protein